MPIQRAFSCLFQLLMLSVTLALPAFADTDPLQADQEMLQQLQKSQEEVKLQLSQMEQMQQLQKLMENPYVQRYLKVVMDSEVQQGLRKVAEHPNRMHVIYAEVGWLLLMFIFRAWLSGRTQSFVLRLFNGLWSFVLMTAGSIYIPSLVLGTPYMNLLRRIAELSGLFT